MSMLAGITKINCPHLASLVYINQKSTHTPSERKVCESGLYQVFCAAKTHWSPHNNRTVTHQGKILADSISEKEWARRWERSRI